MIAAVIGLVLGIALVAVLEHKSSTQARTYEIPSVRLVQEIKRRKAIRVRRS